MADLERELQRLVDPPLAEPAPVTDLEGRASRRRRYRWIRRAVAAGTAAALVAAFVVVATGGDATRVRPAAPSVTGGSADLFVQSTTVGDDGTRALLPPQLIEDDAFADPDVDVVDGQSRDFAVVVDEHDPTTIRLPTVALSWDESSDLALVDGARPEAPDEVALNRVAIDEYDLSVGDDVLLRFGGDVLAEVVEQLPTGTPTADPLREPTRDSNTYCSPGEACSAPEMRLEDLDNQASRTAADPSTSGGPGHEPRDHLLRIRGRRP